MSHSKVDTDFCNKFDSLAARIGVKVFRSEFEDIDSPAWKTIKKELNSSIALFLLVGKGLIDSQKKAESNSEWAKKWKYTQNWISYEIGLACQLGIDVWVICDNVKINFPIPYLNNYVLYGIDLTDKVRRDWIKGILNAYKDGKNYPVDRWNRVTFTCPTEGCGSVYNLHHRLKKDVSIVCPTCLKVISLPNGWRLSGNNEETKSNTSVYLAKTPMKTIEKQNILLPDKTKITDLKITNQLLDEFYQDACNQAKEKYNGIELKRFSILVYPHHSGDNVVLFLDFYSEYGKKILRYRYNSSSKKVNLAGPIRRIKQESDKITFKKLPWKTSPHWIEFIKKAGALIPPQTSNLSTFYHVSVEPDSEYPWYFKFTDGNDGEEYLYSWTGKKVDDKNIKINYD